MPDGFTRKIDITGLDFKDQADFFQDIKLNAAPITLHNGPDSGVSNSGSPGQLAD